MHSRRAGALVLAVVLSMMAPAAVWAAGGSTGGAATPGSLATTTTDTANIDQSREQLIRRLVNLTDTPEMKALFSQELIDRVSSALSMFGPTLNPRTMNVIQQQTRAVVSEHIADGDALYSVLAPVYEKHFNLIELNQLVQFYQSPLGQKLVNTSPELLSETMELGSQWGLSLVPEIVQRVRSRLHEPGATGTGSATP